jgi:uncharacterized protein (TIGR02145 family)
MKARTLLSVSAAIALLASCSTEQNAPGIPQEETGEVYLEVTAGQPATPVTRIAYDEEDDDGDGIVGMTTAWSEDDQLAVASYNTTALNTLRATDYLTTEAGTPATFAGKIATGSPDGKYNFYHPVPAAAAISGNSVIYDYSGQSNTLKVKNKDDKDENNMFIADANVMSSLDVLYTEKAADPTKGSITLTRASAIVRFELTIPQGTSVINSIELSATPAAFAEKLSLVFEDNGDVSANQYGDKVSTISLAISGDETRATDDRSINAYMLLPGTTDLSAATSVTLSAVSGSRKDGTATAVYSYSFGDYFDKNDVTLDAGYTYTFNDPTLTKEETTWAGSNIYWDSVKKQLTFAPADNTNYDAYQGVFFKWGSLVGISPAQYNSSNDWSTGVTTYVPEYDSETSTFTKWNFMGYTSYGNVPYEDDPFTAPYNTSQNRLYYADAEKQATQWADKTGDICQFLGAIGAAPAGYRMPRAEEFGATGWTTAINPPGTEWGSDNTLGNVYGTALLNTKGYARWENTRKEAVNFPAAGSRADFPAGELSGVGLVGYYWSSSASNATSGYNLNFFDSRIYPSGQGNRQSANPIRCVKN